jgi:hypothetical protein
VNLSRKIGIKGGFLSTFSLSFSLSEQNFKLRFGVAIFNTKDSRPAQPLTAPHRLTDPTHNQPDNETDLVLGNRPALFNPARFPRRHDSTPVACPNSEPAKPISAFKLQKGHPVLVRGCPALTGTDFKRFRGAKDRLSGQVGPDSVYIWRLSE